MIDPRRRALAALAGGAYVPTDEVDAEQVPADAVPDVPEPLPSPDSEEVARGKPVVGEVHAAPDEYAQALQQSHERAFQESLAGVGSGIIKAFTGVGRDGDDEARRNFINEPIAQYLQKQKEADAALKQQHAVRPPVAGRPQKSTDPNSPESKRAQSNIRATLGDQYTEDEIAQMSEADADSVMKYGSMKRGAEVTREGQVGAQKRFEAQHQQQAQQFAQRMDLEWTKLSQDEQLTLMRLAESKAAREAAAAERQGERVREATVPGFEPAGDTLPTRTDADKMKEASEAADRMRGNIADLRTLHRKYGEAPKGAGAELQQQKLRAIQIEAKNIAGLGALSGPDFSLMQDLSTQDVNSVGAWVRRNFMGATLEQSLQGLEQWMNTTIAATAKARGYAPKKPPPAPQRKPAATVLPTDSTGQPTLDAPADAVRIILNGKPKDVPRANLEKVKALAKQKGYTLEVPNG